MARIALSVLSIVLLTVLGLMGGALPDLLHARTAAGCGRVPVDLPYPTAVAAALLGRHGDDFALSLTPLMVAFAGLAACWRGKANTESFRTGFAIAWLLSLIYAGLYAWAWMLPFGRLCADLDDRSIGTIVMVIDVALVAAVASILWRRRRTDARQDPQQ